MAHRGFGDRYPQNTVRAFREAAKVADCVEVDVRRSGSGDLVASHFNRLWWSTDATGRVRDRSTAELESLRVEGSDCGIPRLERALDAIPPDVRIDLDLKEPGLADDVFAVAERADNETAVSSFYSDALWEARDRDVDASLAYNCDVRIDRHLTTTRLLECDRANFHWAVCLATDAPERAASQGMDVFAWPVGSRLVAWALGRRGIDGIIATTPAVASWAEAGAETGDRAVPGACLPTRVRSHSR